ncbi:MAG: competence/damage-inducible protein A [Holosporales bacterium]
MRSIYQQIMTPRNPTAALIIIGNEILSGRTQDTNLAVLATALGQQGIELREVRVIPDDEAVIITTLNTLRAQMDHVFTSGGIGPTHDDITSASIAKAFGVPLRQHPDALRMLHEHYPPEQLNAARLKMAEVPVGATLIENPVSKAPGFTLENVHVMAGVPRIFKAMLDFLMPRLPGGSPVLSETVSTTLAEGTIAATLTELQQAFPDVNIGSYPYFRQGQMGVSVVFRGTDQGAITTAAARLRAQLNLH